MELDTAAPVAPAGAVRAPRVSGAAAVVVSWALAVAGAAVRVEQFSTRRSLWLDEALVAGSIVARGWTGLLRPLANHQAGPIGWLWAEHLSVVAFGNNEYALRVVPLLASLAGLCVGVRLARLLPGIVAGPLFVFLLAAAPDAVRYSGEIKQYSSELFIALALTLVAAEVMVSADPRRLLALWAAAGVVAEVFSYPAVFVLAGTAVVLCVWAAPRGHLRAVILASAVWAVAFVGVWSTTMRATQGDALLSAFWSGAFPRSLAPGSWVPWVVRLFPSLARDPAFVPAGWIWLALAILGAVLLVRRRLAFAAGVWLAPLLVAVAAASLHLYPTKGRLALWAVPAAYFVIAGGAAGFDRARVGRGAWAAAWTVAVIVVSWPATALTLGFVGHPITFSAMRPLMEATRAQVRPGDQVWVHDGSSAAAQYYAPIVHLPVTWAVHDTNTAGGCSVPTDLRAAAGGDRVWLLYGYVSSIEPTGDEAMLERAMGAAGARLEEVIRRPQASAELWDFGAGTGAPATGACVSLGPPERIYDP